MIVKFQLNSYVTYNCGALVVKIRLRLFDALFAAEINQSISHVENVTNFRALQRRVSYLCDCSLGLLADQTQGVDQNLIAFGQCGGALDGKFEDECTFTGIFKLLAIVYPLGVLAELKESMW